MHEMSIVEALLDVIRQELRGYPDTHVRTVFVRVGALRQVVPEMLATCYEAAVRGTTLEGSRLEVQPVGAEARCRQCSSTFVVEDNWFECPRCQALGADLLRGNELELMTLELAIGG